MYLEETLKNPGFLEIRLRVKPILAQKQRERRAGITLDQLCQIRAVKVLEWLGDGEAKKWAGGRAGARLTMEAAVALKRLEGGSRANP